MYKDFESKFELLAEEEITRYKQGGVLSGDIVKIRSDWTKNDKLKGRPSQFYDKIKELIGGPYPLKVTAVKSERPESQHSLYGGVDGAVTAYWVDIAQIINPGFWTNPITLPLEVIEIQDLGANLPPVPDEQKYDAKVQIKPVEDKKGDPKSELQQQTKADEKELVTKNIKIETAGKEPKDGRDQVDDPVEYKKSKKSKKSKKESIQFEDDIIAEAYDQVKNLTCQ